MEEFIIYLVGMLFSAWCVKLAADSFLSRKFFLAGIAVSTFLVNMNTIIKLMNNT